MRGEWIAKDGLERLKDLPPGQLFRLEEAVWYTTHRIPEGTMLVKIRNDSNIQGKYEVGFTRPPYGFSGSTEINKDLWVRPVVLMQGEGKE